MNSKGISITLRILMAFMIALIACCSKPAGRVQAIRQTKHFNTVNVVHFNNMEFPLE